jgi:proteasome accessory factor B
MYFLVDADHQRVPTVSRKSERLVNLTIALLATKRWITKSEIFATVDGYEGEADSKERMFERDKDDLRNLGITIEVGTFDPLFEDEAGYRIRPESYRIQLSNLDPVQLSLLSLAVQAWQGAALNESALSAITKLKGLGIESDIGELPISSPSQVSDNPYLLSIVDAISRRRTISFGYIASDSSIINRLVEPYGVISRDSFWYLVGNDCEKKAERTFRLDRIVDEIKVQGKENSYEIPLDFEIDRSLISEDTPQTATLLLRKDKANQLRQRGDDLQDQGEWDQISIQYIHPDSFVKEILWHLDDVQVLAPQSLRDGVIEALSKVVALHE